MAPQSRTVEEKLAQVATKQHGVVTWSQLLDARVSKAEIKKRVEKGLLIREYRGTYRVGHRAPSLQARYMAAVLACGEGAALSGKAAGYLLSLLKGSPPPPEVITPTERRVRGVRIRRRRRLDTRDVMTFRGIPVTTVPRTLVDLAAVLDESDLARACHEAGVLYGTKPAHVEVVLARSGNPPGAAKLRAVLRGKVRVTLSRLEGRFLALLTEAGLALPITNRPAGARRVDCRWPGHRLTIELDSYRYHGSRHAWEQDRRREREAHTRGDDFRRFTHDDVFERPQEVLAELRALLA